MAQENKTYKTLDKGKNYDSMSASAKTEVSGRFHELAHLLMDEATTFQKFATHLDNKGLFANRLMILSIKNIVSLMMLLGIVLSTIAEFYESTPEDTSSRLEGLWETIRSILE